MSIFDNLEVQKVYIYECTECGNPKRRSVKKDVAKNGLCRSCRRKKAKLVPGQEELFNLGGTNV